MPTARMTGKEQEAGVQPSRRDEPVENDRMVAMEPQVTRRILGSRVEVATLRSAADRLLEWAARRRPAFVCFATAYMLVLASRDEEIHRTYDEATMNTPDGTPVAWCLRLLGHPEADCISGPRLMPMLLADAAARGLPVGFYGGRVETLARMQAALGRDLPALQVGYAYSPPFRELGQDEREAIAREIKASGTRILFVGLGSPKQDLWMRDQVASIGCVCLGVGAAFEFLSGEKVLPPFWVQRLGLTWLVRLSQEPRRLFRRNLYSPVFVIMFALEYLFGMRVGQRTFGKEEEPVALLDEELAVETPAE